MIFRVDETIVSCDHGPTRWMVDRTWTWNSVEFATVRDLHPDVTPPMRRMASACCISFDRAGGDEWLVREWRRQFEQAVHNLAVGFAGLPEPVDFLYALNTTAPIPRGVPRDEPILVYQFDPGRPVKSLEGTGNAATFNRVLATFIRGLADVLRAVHDAGFVMRQVPLPSVAWNDAARRYGLREGLALMTIGQSNFHPRIRFPMVDPRWTAPECHEADAEVTPASDVYALGKTVLALLGHDVPPRPLLPGVHDAVEAVNLRFPGRLPDRIRRLLLLALHPDPRQRLRDMDQVVGMLHDGPEPPPLPAAPPLAIAPEPASAGPHRGPRPQSAKPRGPRSHEPLAQGPVRKPGHGAPRDRGHDRRGGG